MNLLFDFTVDKATHTIHVTREFAADLDLVWDAFTKAELLDQWWAAPPQWIVRTKVMDFREGGRWLYAMITPENVSYYSLTEFIKIVPRSSFTSRNSFSDENGDPIDTGFTSSITTNTFKAGDGVTTVKIEKKMANLAELEKFVAMGYQHGVVAGFNNLDNFLLTLDIKK